MKLLRVCFVSVVVVGLGSASTSRSQEPASVLPKVVLLGDSIRLSYTPYVEKALAGQAAVISPKPNAGDSGRLFMNLEEWAIREQPAVVHFNCGIHDLKKSKTNGQFQVPPEEYAANLRKIVERLRQETKAVLLFALTTPIHDERAARGRQKVDYELLEASAQRYNQVALEVMRELKVPVTDTRAALGDTAQQHELLGRDGIHFTAPGYEKLGGAVAAAVRPYLNQQAQAGAANVFATNFQNDAYGSIPRDWIDLIDRRPSRNWIVDGQGYVRPVLKFSTGLLVYDGELADGNTTQSLGDVLVAAEFKKTEDQAVSFGLAGRVQDRDHYYLARFRGVDRLELLKVKAGVESPLDHAQPITPVTPRPTGLVSLTTYRAGQIWKLSLAMKGDLITAAVTDQEGREVARMIAKDDEYKQGRVALCCTTFAAARSFQIAADNSAPRVNLPPKATASVTYPVVKPHWNTRELDTPLSELRDQYDVVVAGAGTGGCAAAIQAARLGARVLLLEETDWIGGQMCAAAVATMDEDGGYGKFPVRERGLYREFHESMVAYYQTLDKDPFVAYFSYPEQLEGGYEPRVARAVLYGFIAETRSRSLAGGKRPVLDVSLRSRVTAVHKQASTVTGVTVEIADSTGRHEKRIASTVLIDATEYGDVTPLTGARYRVGNSTSDKVDPEALVQDHTWTAVLREYPGGVPTHLQVREPPPGYDEWAGRRYRSYQRHGIILWGAAGKGVAGPRNWRQLFAWRGMADTDSPLVGIRSNQRHTQCGFNGGNDYPVTAATIEDPAQRRRDEREGIHRTLGALYYFQHELGVNWSLAEDEGYDTPYNREKMKSLDLRVDLAPLAVHLPQLPYVRECRRLIGVRTLAAADLTRYEEARHFASSVAMGDYFMDLDHGKTAHAIEPDLDTGELPRGGGAFQVPFEVFLPETLDGFLPAEKNISQSRLANGATRLQPITMLTGQAAGTIAALAVKERVQPRKLDEKQVQAALLDSGCTLIQRWYADVPWGTPLWRATQLLSLYQVLDRPGPLERVGSSRVDLQACKLEYSIVSPK